MNSPIFLSYLAPFLNQFVQYKRALNRKYCADAEVLRLFDRYIQSRNISAFSAIDSSMIDDFLRSHPLRSVSVCCAGSIFLRRGRPAMVLGPLPCFHRRWSTPAEA
jgi:hypothetical protein